MISRRTLVGALGLGAVALPLFARAQAKERVPKIGFISGISRPESLETSYFGGFIQGMRERGHIEGKTFIMEWRFAEVKFERFAEIAKELVGMNVDVIVVASTPAAHAVQAVTKTVPIVVPTAGDPVSSGLVASLARPGGNVTGLSQNMADAAPKSLELLKTVVRKLSRVGAIWNPGNQSNVSVLKGYQDAAPKFGARIQPLEARSAAELEPAIVALSRGRADAVVVLSDPVFLEGRRLIAEKLLGNRLPSLALQIEYVEIGLLMSYGQSLRELFRRSASYVDKILKGAKPADLPIEQPNVYELAVNLKTARALGLQFPRSILARADRTFE